MNYVLYAYIILLMLKTTEILASTNYKTEENVTNSFKVLLLVSHGGFEI